MTRFNSINKITNVHIVIVHIGATNLISKAKFKHNRDTKKIFKTINVSICNDRRDYLLKVVVSYSFFVPLDSRGIDPNWCAAMTTRQGCGLLLFAQGR